MKCDAHTAERCPPCLPLPLPLSGWVSGCLPLSLCQLLPVCVLLLHGDVKLIVDARVLFVEDDLESKTGAREQKEIEVRSQRSFARQTDSQIPVDKCTSDELWNSVMLEDASVGCMLSTEWRTTI